MTPVVLITVQPRAPGSGATTTLRLAGGGGTKPYFYAGTHWRAGISTLPRFRAELGFDESGWTGGVVPTTGTISWAPASKALLSELAAYHWPGAAITIEEALEEDGVFTTRLTGKVADAPVQDQRLVITAADLGADLAKPLVTARFLGTGGVEGSPEAKGRPKRRTWGRSFQIEGRVLDKVNNVYEFGDLAFPWQSFEVLRDMGRPASPAPAVLAWQGSVAATLIALAASAPASGTGVVAPSIACVKWWTRPAGPFTADVKGEIGPGYVETAPSIADRILTAAAGPAVTNVAAANGWRGDVAGIHADEGETTAAVLDRLLLPISLFWIPDPAGTVTLREITFAGPVETLRSDSVTRLRSLPPVKTRRVGYQKANRTHNDGELATILLEAGGSFVQATPPAALESAPGAHWLDSDDNFRTNRRIPGSGYLQLAGGALLLNGAPVELAWVAVPAGPAEKAQWGLVIDDNGFKPADDADVTAANQVTVAPPTRQRFAADHLGNIPSSAFPRVLTPGVIRGGASIRTDTTASYSISVVNVAATINNTGGSADKGKITITGVTGATGWIDLTVTVAGVAQPVWRILVDRDDADPPSGGTGTGGGTGNKDGDFGPVDQISSTTYVKIGTRITVTKATGETIRAYAPLGYQYYVAGGGNKAASLKWRYAAAGTNFASPTDFGSPVTGSASGWDGENGSPGSAACTQTAAPTNGDYDVELWAALPTAGGVIEFAGNTCSVAVAV